MIFIQDLFWNIWRRSCNRLHHRSRNRSRQWIGFGLSLGLVTVLLLLNLQPTVAAWSTQVSPAQPQLGDTLAVTIQDSTRDLTQDSTQDSTGQPPQIQFAGKTYPTYALGPNRYRALLPTTPLDRPGPQPIQVQSGRENQLISVTLGARSFPTQHITLPPGQDGNVSDWEFDQVDAFKRIVTPEKLWSGKFIRPNEGDITTIYGVRRYYNGVFAEDYYHRGVDYAGDYGSKVIAPAAGRVAFVGYENQGYKVHGNIVGIDHGQGIEGIFMHLNSIQVKLGDFVKAGQAIGTLGDTGAATGPHLHWGMYVNGQAVDPVPWRESGFE